MFIGIHWCNFTYIAYYSVIEFN